MTIDYLEIGNIKASLKKDEFNQAIISTGKYINKTDIIEQIISLQPPDSKTLVYCTRESDLNEFFIKRIMGPHSKMMASKLGLYQVLMPKRRTIFFVNNVELIEEPEDIDCVILVDIQYLSDKMQKHVLYSTLGVKEYKLYLVVSPPANECFIKELWFNNEEFSKYLVPSMKLDMNPEWPEETKRTIYREVYGEFVI